MYHPKRPTPVSFLVAGSVCTTGTIAVAIRVIHNCTDFKVVEPFNTLTLAVGVTYAFVGPVVGGWLVFHLMRRANAALRAENAALRAERRTYDTLLEAIQKADSQVEVTTVLCRKILKETEAKRANDDTQPIAKLHSINGGGNG